MDPREFPTKGNLMLAKNSLMLARQGYDLMDKKRNILLKELMGLIDEAKDIQEEIDATFTKAYACLQRANIEHGISKVQELAFTVPIEDSLKMQTRSIMGTEIPHVKYVPDAGQRIDLYRRIALIRTEEQRSDMLDELIDRFGEPPEEATALLDIALLRSQASEKGIAEIKQQDGRLLLTFAETDFVRLSALCGDAAFKGRLLLNAGSSPYLSLRLEKTEKAMDMARLLVARYGAAAG